MRIAARLERVEQTQAQRRQEVMQAQVQTWVAYMTNEGEMQRLFTYYQSDPRFVDAAQELDRLFQRENRGELMRHLHADLYPEGRPQ